ncbi:MAG: AAA family ATPase [Gammaproteobacteria bacterium]
MAIEPTIDLAPNRATEWRSGSAFFYLCPPLAQRATLVLHLLGFSRQPVLVMAERGMGKTSLLEYLLRAAPENWSVSRVEGEKLCGRPTTAKRVLEGFGLKPSLRSISDGPPLIKTILAELGANRIPVLLVDDAHKLPPESLSLLMDSAPWEREEGGLHMAFFGTPLIDTVLNTPELRPRLRQFVHRVELSPFTEQQTREYLVQRSAAAGREGPLPLSAAEVRQIFKQSLGVPRRINELTRETLVQEDPRSLGLEEDLAHTVQPSHSGLGFSRAAAVVIVVLAILGLWIVRQPGDDSPELVLVPPISQPDITESSQPVGGRKKDIPPATQTSKTSIQEQPQTAGKIDPTPHPTPVARESITAVTSGLRGPQWLQAQQADRYVVQLFASRDRKAVFRFLHEQNDRLQLAWFSTASRGRPWYAVVEGLYPDRDSAHAAVAKVQSVAGISSSPWPRSIASIKKALKETP